MIGDFGTVVDYTRDDLELVQTTCLTVATVLGDLMEEDITIVGGLVPVLLIDQMNLPEGVETHPGTLDLDLALQLVVLEGERYKDMAERLRGAGFRPDKNNRGNPTVQRWMVDVRPGRAVRVDFLIPPVEGADLRRIFFLESDFGAILTPGLELAFIDRFRQRLEGTTIRGARVARDVWVCGPAALVILKALACRGRDKPKDAFDLYYVVRNYGQGPDEVAARLCKLNLLDHPSTLRALEILRNDFAAPDGFGPDQVTTFLGVPDDDPVSEDVVAFVAAFLAAIERGRSAGHGLV